MGLLKKYFQNTAESIVANALDTVIFQVPSAVADHVRGIKNSLDLDHKRKYLSKHPESMAFVIQKTSALKDNFCVLDVYSNVQYYVKGAFTKLNSSLSILDTNNNVIGSARKALIAVRSPFGHEKKPANYILSINGNKTATLKTILSNSSEKYVVEPFGWSVKGHILSWDFSVYDGDVRISRIYQIQGSATPAYMIDVPKKEHSLIGLLIVLSLICNERGE